MSESESKVLATTRYPLLQTLQKRADQLVPFLPKGYTVEKIGQIVQMMAVKQPDLLQCTPSSLIIGISRGLRAGLELGETWHLLTFKNKELSEKHGRDVFECTGVADYKGLAQLMVASGAVRYVDPQVVREGDVFGWTLGLNKTLEHVPQSATGKITHAYVVLTLPFGVKDFLVMPIEQIDAIRKGKSRQWKHGDCPEWYAKKTVVRQIAKLLPKDKRMMALHEAIAQDEAGEIETVDLETGEVIEVKTVPDGGVRPTRDVAVDYARQEEMPRLTKAVVSEELDLYEDDAA